MKKGKLWGIIPLICLFLGSSLAGVPTAESPEAWKGLSPEQIKKIKAGEIIILDKDQSSGDEAKRFIQAAMIFNQPIEAAWNLFIQTEKQEQYLPRLYDSPLVERYATWDKVDFYVKFAFIDIKYRVKHNYDNEQFYFYWALDPSYKNDLNHLEGYWRLYKVDDTHTLARYGTIVMLSELIPKSIMEEMTRRDLPESMQAVKKYIDSGGSYAKPGYK